MRNPFSVQIPGGISPDDVLSAHSILQYKQILSHCKLLLPRSQQNKRRQRRRKREVRNKRLKVRPTQEERCTDEDEPGGSDIEESQ